MSKNKAQTVVLIKEKNQTIYEIPTKNPNSEFAPDGLGKLIQEYNFKSQDFVAYYEPSEEDWKKGLVILKITDVDTEEISIIEIKLVEYIFPANVFIKNNKFLKFKKYENFIDKKIDFKFNFKLFYKDENEEEYILMERNNNIFSNAPSLNILLSETLIDEIKYIKENNYKLMIQIDNGNNKEFLDCVLEIDLKK